MRKTVGSGMVLLALSTMSTVYSAAAQNNKPQEPALRERLVDQLERTRERERWLEIQLERIDNGEEIDKAQFSRDRFESQPRREGDQPREIIESELLLVVDDLLGQDNESDRPSPFRDILKSEGVERTRLLRGLEPRLRKLVELRDRDPEKYEIHLQEMRAGMQIAKAARSLGVTMAESESEEEIEAAKQKLRAAISEAFDARAAMALHELAAVQDKLNDLTEEIANAETQRQDRIEMQFEAILRKVKDGGWAKRERNGERGPPDGGRPRRSGDD
jgi:hypothetical protein